MLVGRLGTDGRLNGRVKCDLTENLILKINASVVIVFYFYFCNEENKSSLLSSMLNVLLFFLTFFFISSLQTNHITPRACSTLITRFHFLNNCDVCS